jgi:peroxiredoxin
VHPRHHITKQHKPISIPVGEKLPNVTLSYLNRNGAVQTVALSSLCKGKRVVLVGVPAAFSPTCAQFVKRVESAKSVGSDLIACVAVNDVLVMKAWGENLAVGEKVMMLSDGCGQLSAALGVSLDMSGRACLGFGVRSRRFCLSSFNGVITSVNFDEEEEEDFFVSPKTK